LACAFPPELESEDGIGAIELLIGTQEWMVEQDCIEKQKGKA
jgi:hypothetical protein